MAETADDGWGEALAEAADGARSASPPPAAAPAVETGDDDADWAAALSEQVAEPGTEMGAAGPSMDMSMEMPSSEAPSLVPDGPAGPMDAATAEEPQEDIESVAARRLLERSAANRRRRLKVALPLLILLLVGLNAAVLVWRADVVRALPQTASLFAAIGLPVNLRGLEFANVTVTRDQHEGVSVLVVEGLILSVAKTPVDVPRLRLSIRNESGAEIYSWTTLPTRNILGAGEQLPFRSRLASPPADGREVMVRFFNRKDLATATR